MKIITSLESKRDELRAKKKGMNDQFDQFKDRSYEIPTQNPTEQLIKDMQMCINNPYNQNTVENILNRIKTTEAPTGASKEEYDKLVGKVKDYRFTMFELARVFELYDENYKGSGMRANEIMRKLDEDGETEFVKEIPYTYNVLQEFINRRGRLSPSLKQQLQESCPDAFSDYTFS